MLKKSNKTQKTHINKGKTLRKLHRAIKSSNKAPLQRTSQTLCYLLVGFWITITVKAKYFQILEMSKENKLLFDLWFVIISKIIYHPQ